MTRLVLYLVPAITVLMVALSLLVVAAPRPVVGARVRGGPSPDGKRLSLQLDVTRHQGNQATIVSERVVRAEIRERGEVIARWNGRLDAEGIANVNVEASRQLPEDPVVLVTAPWHEAPLALGTIDTRAPRWGENPRRLGGFIKPRREGDLALRVAPARGALAVPFETSLLVEVERDGSPVANVELEFGTESLDIIEPPSPTNERGRSVLSVRPTAHVASLELRARAPTDERGRWYSTLPVVGGAMLAQVLPPERALATRAAKATLEVRSPIVRDRAHVAIVTRSGRFSGHTVALEAQTDGSARQTILAELPDDESWLVVSSEPDLAAPSAVGWPSSDVAADFLAGRTSRAPRTFTVSDVQLLDGVTPQLREEARRQTRVRRVTGLFVATAMALVIMLLLLRVRDSELRLQRHLERTAGDARAALTPSRARSFIAVVVAVLCVMLGFLILVLMAMLRG